VINSLATTTYAARSACGCQPTDTQSEAGLDQAHLRDPDGFADERRLADTGLSEHCDRSARSSSRSSLSLPKSMDRIVGRAANRRNPTCPLVP
jgi:hypothetical protein